MKRPWNTRYREVRARTEALCRPLEVEDYVIQSMPDASPAKWHLAHTTWFFETFLLRPHVPGSLPYDESYSYLFNSYYHTVGERWARPARGLLSRPTVAQVYDYRRAIDELVLKALPRLPELAEPILELGLHHEQQHQELLLTDLKHAFGLNPLRPSYLPPVAAAPSVAPPLVWLETEGGLRGLGHDGDGFAFDNESPRHRVFVEPFRLASRLTTTGEYLAFLEDGGYRRPELWLSDGWDARTAQGWQAPLYWDHHEGDWRLFTLRGMHPLNPDEPVSHVSYYEADAFARWSGCRLPTEAEWETAASPHPIRGNFLETERLHSHAPADATSAQFFGDVWEWTSSTYASYPGYRPPSGPLGEYNGKFMGGRMVLRGGSCLSPSSHLRATYRNFFAPETRWQMSGIRLARDL